MQRNGSKHSDAPVIWTITISVLVILLVIGGYFVYTHWNGTGDQEKNIISNEDQNNGENPNSNDSPLPEEISKDLFGKYYPDAKKLLAEMSIEEKVGQLFFARCPEIDQVEEIKELTPGGYILFGRDFKNHTKAQVVENIKSYQEASQIPMLIGVDEEGGTVVRASLYKAFRNTPFESPQHIYQKGGMDGIKNDTIEKAQFLKELGINVNLAPVCDVSTNSKDFMYQRSFGKEATATAEYVATVVKTMKEQNMAMNLKHFPGYGNNADTHTGIAIDQRTMQSFENVDFVPFAKGIEVGAESILVSHNVVECMDAKYPASISKEVHDVLKNKLGFSGIIMTDDMAMEGIKQYATEEEAAVLAIQAGNDMIITSDLKVQKEAILKAIQKDVLTEEMINECVKKVLAWKISLGLIQL